MEMVGAVRSIYRILRTSIPFSDRWPVPFPLSYIDSQGFWVLCFYSVFIRRLEVVVVSPTVKTNYCASNCFHKQTIVSLYTSICFDNANGEFYFDGE